MIRCTILAAVLLTTACAGTPPHLSDTMTQADQDKLNGAHWYAFNGTLAQQSVWASAATGLGGTVHALKEYRDPATGQTCRKLVEDTRSTAGERDIRIGTACRQPDGSLTVVYSGRADQVEE